MRERKDAPYGHNERSYIEVNLTEGNTNGPSLESRALNSVSAVGQSMQKIGHVRSVPSSVYALTRHICALRECSAHRSLKS